MMFTPLPREDVEANWPWLSSVLAPAVIRDPGNTLEDVKRSLINGPDLVMIASGTANGVIVFEITPELECWVKYVSGSLCGGPRARVKQMREAMAWIERKAAEIGCTEIRLCGRNWSRILTDFRLMSEWPNGLRKVLEMKEAA